MKIANYELKKGELTRGLLEIGKRHDESVFGIPFLGIRGPEDGPVLVIDGCVHGDEVEGALAAVKFMQSLDPAEVSGTVIAVPVVNIPAFMVQQRGAYPAGEATPIDMARSWPGNRNEEQTRRLAGSYWEEVATKANYLISLHGGGSKLYISKRVIYDGSSEESFELAQAVGWSLLEPGRAEPGGFRHIVREHDIPAIVVELGGTPARMPHNFDDNVSEIVVGLVNVMRHYKMLPGEAHYPDKWQIVDPESEMFATHSGLVRPEEGLKRGGPVRKGDNLLSIVSLYGETLETLTAPSDGILLGFNAMFQARPGEYVCKVGKILRTVERQ
jgi:predicted deacylase